MQAMVCVPVSSAARAVLTLHDRVTIEARAYRAIGEWAKPRLDARGRWARVY